MPTIRFYTLCMGGKKSLRSFHFTANDSRVALALRRHGFRVFSVFGLFQSVVTVQCVIRFKNEPFSSVSVFQFLLLLCVEQDSFYVICTIPAEKRQICRPVCFCRTRRTVTMQSIAIRSLESIRYVF